MIQWLNNIILALVETLRRLWQRLTGRTPRPVPIPIRIQRFASPFSRILVEPRTRTVGNRHGSGW